MALMSPQISTKSMVPLCRQLATAFDAGIPIVQSLDLVRRQVRDRRIRSILGSMVHDIRRGTSLREAAEAQQKYFPALFVQLLGAGEQGGRLDIMLNDLADYYEDRLAINREVIRASTYPILLCLTALVILPFAYGLLKYITLDSTVTFNLGAYLTRDYLPRMGYVFLSLACAGLLAVALARAGLLKWVTGAVSTHVWPFSTVINKLGIARFFRSFGLLLGSGVPLVDCIQRAAESTANPYIRKDLLKAIGPVRQGDTLVQAFSGSRYMSDVARELLMVGEQSGKLEESSLKAADIHMKEANHAITIMLKVFSVGLLLAVILSVAYFIIRFYMQYFGGLMNELGI